MEKGNYGKFLLMLLVSFIVMYAVMYANVASEEHIYFSLNRFYMTILMVVPMGFIMLLFMQRMYKNRKKNNVLIITGVLLFTAAFVMLRTQTYINDVRYMEAMIPHHSSAILSSQHADLKDPEVQELSKKIIESQQKEIEQMKAMIQRLKNSTEE
ncbi:DUF305 domain-containing protein [Flavobacterium beibuense]|uniref:DUF305 domain-containing protein n=1 Tax=Flavobacterium beibuense F44-8 TaxID=1406840 RepID=A0A0A2LW89_9FLAO|nr:DUF305 domain-containing protein [Flavobacterium beibuense]KGO83503.1 hypothetical protein Q763_02750 [Flavobacterium beibuense F44-8]